MVGEIILLYQGILDCKNIKVVEVTKPYHDELTINNYSEKTTKEEQPIRRSSSLYSTLDSITICAAGRLGEGSSKRWIKKALEE